jgi:Ca-activated chloride channel family protein
LCASVLVPRTARADWREWLRSKNGHVERGNEKVAANDAKAALAHYDKAARELPAEGGVHLDRGLALMQTGDAAKAREAFRLATQPPASREVRADAHYNLGLGFYKEADALAQSEQHEEAQQLFREAVDAFRQSLRLRPGNRDAAWNLELGARRIREQEEKQKEKERQNEDKKDEDEKDPNQEPQDQDGDGKPDPKQDEGQNPEDEKKDEGKKEDEKKEEPKPDKNDPKQPQEPKPQPKDPAQPQPSPQAKPLPADVSHALDALQDSEENLERLKARIRAQQERRMPEKDW